jgi:hypothetical protein
MNIKDTFCSHINLSNIEGLSTEIKDFFMSEKSINSFDLEYINNKKTYKINCITADLNPIKIKDIFMRFTNFIQYPGFTLYTQSKTKQKIEYELISGSEDMTCFCCTLTFSQH